MSDEFAEYRKGDWTFACDICGEKAWASESTLLDAYTGRGGLRVCKECNDPIDYGIVPFVVPAEKPVPWVRDAYYSDNNIWNNPPSNLERYTPFDAGSQDPFSGQKLANNITWDQQLTFTWDQITFQTWDQWTSG